MDSKEYIEYKYWCTFLEYWSQKILCYGKILTDDNFEERITVDYKTKYTRIRTIKYNNHIHYHKMVSGKVVEVKELM